MADKFVWSVKGLKSKGSESDLKTFKIEWSECKVDTRSGYRVVKARDEEEAKENFWSGKNIVEEGILYTLEGKWDGLEIDDIEKCD